MGHYYKASGKVAPVSALYFLLTTLIVFPLLGLIYAYAIWYIPFIYLNLIIAAATGFGVAIAINKFVVRGGKVRNPAAASLLGLLGGLVTLYFHWAVWVDLVINMGETIGSERIGVTVSNIKILQVFALASDPVGLFSLIGEIKEFGTWGLSSTAVSGTPLLIIWIIEAIIIVGIAAFIPAGSAKVPYCEIGNTWFDELTLPAMSYVSNPGKMRTQLEADDSAAFSEWLKFDGLPDADYSVPSLYTSTFDEHYLTIDNKRATKNDKGEVEFGTDEFVEYISITSPMKELLIKKGATPFSDT